MNTFSPLWTGFLRSAESFPDRPAVFVEGQAITYSDLEQKVRRIAATIQHHLPSQGPPLCSVFAYRSLTAFAGVLGSLLSGNGYVPFNPTFPIERTRLMLELSGCRSIIVDQLAASQIDTLIEGFQDSLLLIFPDIEDVDKFAQKWPQHSVIGAKDLEPSNSWYKPITSSDSLAYLLFTSGSTGIPKAVMVTHKNVISFIHYMSERYEITENDRLSQMFDMTFDVSAFDMFISWEKGACVCCPSRKAMIKPGSFIQNLELTVWFSVPSTVIIMKRLGMLKPGRYPSLRWSLFAGEALPMELVQAWSQAAPNSKLENLYGPTELTITCTVYRWDPKLSPEECEMGVVPIGYPLPNMNVLVADENLKEVPPGSVGELLMNGPQMSPGYWRNPEKTAAAFVIPFGKDEIFYRTGDRVRRPKGNGPLTYLGRIDYQIKIQGRRVELGEIEAITREQSGLDGVVALGWPITSSGYEGIEVFLEGEKLNEKDLHAKVASRLPDFMVPKKFHFMDRLPLNVNGKFDRKALVRMLGESQ